MFAKEQEHLVSPTYFSKEYHEEVNAQWGHHYGHFRNAQF